MADAVKDNGVVFQTGSQQRSEYGGKFRRTVEMVRSGAIGELKKIRVCVGSSPKPCDLPTEATPEGIDWDAWLGPAPMRGNALGSRVQSIRTRHVLMMNFVEGPSQKATARRLTV